ncbi:unnamed protein product [Paramecium octaurelia]|uniref:Uncharacterized protein n=1 Tax=Paramecium octaurelia TaxID=43137 RepID=A0A8S1T0N0_PAROT|nr:unnamed protein product [Paramecium octaurelia]
MKRRCYFQKYEKLQSPDDLLNRLNNEATRPKFIDYIKQNVSNTEKQKLIKQRVCKSQDPLRNVKMDKTTLLQEYQKFLNPENLAYARIQKIDESQEINNSLQYKVNFSKILTFKYQVISPF